MRVAAAPSVSNIARNPTSNDTASTSVLSLRRVPASGAGPASLRCAMPRTGKARPNTSAYRRTRRATVPRCKRVRRRPPASLAMSPSIPHHAGAPAQGLLKGRQSSPCQLLHGSCTETEQSFGRRRSGEASPAKPPAAPDLPPAICSSSCAPNMNETTQAGEETEKSCHGAARARAGMRLSPDWQWTERIPPALRARIRSDSACAGSLTEQTKSWSRHTPGHNCDGTHCDRVAKPIVKPTQRSTPRFGRRFAEVFGATGRMGRRASCHANNRAFACDETEQRGDSGMILEALSCAFAAEALARRAFCSATRAESAQRHKRSRPTRAKASAWTRPRRRPAPQ